jgi:hypothetical protein
MGKHKLTQTQKVKRCTASFPAEFKCDTKLLYCKLCETDVSCGRPCKVQQHRETIKHSDKLAQVARDKPSASQALLAEVVHGDSSESDDDDACKQVKRIKKDFVTDLCEWFVRCDIPLYKIESNAFKAFMEKWTKQTVPSESYVRKTFLKAVYDRQIQNIRQDIASKYIRMGIR